MNPPNNVHAKLLDILRGAGATGIAFTTPLYANNNGSSQLGSLTDADQSLIDAMQQTKVLLPLEVTTQVSDTGSHPDRALILPGHHPFDPDPSAMAAAKPATIISSLDNPLLQAAYAVGHTLAPADADGITRRELAAVAVNHQLLPALSVALAGAADDTDSKQISGKVLLLGNGVKPVAIHHDLSFLPRYNKPEGEWMIPTFSYWRVLNRNFARSNFKGKLVLIGFTEGTNADRVVTPLVPEARIVALASATESLLDGNTYSHPFWAIAMQVLLVLAVIGLLAYSMITLPMLARVGTVGGTIVVLLTGDFLLIRSSNISLELIPLVTGLVLSTVILEAAQFLMGHDKPRRKSSKNNISLETLRTLALTLHGQGQLDLAYETLRRCSVNDETLELLYRLGADFERRGENRRQRKSMLTLPRTTRPSRMHSNDPSYCCARLCRCKSPSAKR